VALLSGEHAAVRSVSAHGTAVVQLGVEAPAGSRQYQFAGGPERTVRVADLQLVPVAKGDRGKLLGGDHLGHVADIKLAEDGEVYCFRDGSLLAMVKSDLCAKVAGD
jgi:hypothetical protein